MPITVRSIVRLLPAVTLTKHAEPSFGTAPCFLRGCGTPAQAWGVSPGALMPLAPDSARDFINAPWLSNTGSPSCVESRT